MEYTCISLQSVKSFWLEWIICSLLLPGTSSQSSGGMSRCHAVPDQFSDWIYFRDWECYHCCCVWVFGKRIRCSITTYNTSLMCGPSNREAPWWPYRMVAFIQSLKKIPKPNTWHKIIILYLTPADSPSTIPYNTSSLHHILLSLCCEHYTVNVLGEQHKCLCHFIQREKKTFPGPTQALTVNTKP